MAGWEDTLITELKTAEASAQRGPLGSEGAGIVEAFRVYRRALAASVTRVGDAIGQAIEARGDEADGRARWSFQQRALALRVDRELGKLIITADLGTDLLMDELTLSHPEVSHAGLSHADPAVIDASGRPADLDALCERYVRLLFQGA